MRKRNALILITALAVCACDEEGDGDGSASNGDSNTALPEPKVDAGPAAAPDCYTTPTTYLELINACTDAEKVVKTPVLPLLLLDGGLPPLP